MFEILGALGLVAFAVASVCIGVRLLWLARRTRGVPEIAVGTGFLVGAVVGYVPETVVLSTDWMAPPTEAAILEVTQVAIRLAAVSVLVFTWRVFRPRSLWAAGLALVLCGALAASWVAFPMTEIDARTSRDRFWYDVFTWARSACTAWGAIESFLYFGRARRGRRLGLVDPLVADRFRLWGVGLGAMTLLMMTTWLARQAGIDPAAHGWVLLESLTGLVGACALWLTFFPTRGYRARVARAARAVAGPA